VPIVSEENKAVAYETRKGYQYSWCVDPLDGTKEFIKRNGQFTVNIALLRGERPVLGVVHTPCQRVNIPEPGRGYRMAT
jgi:3'(2'), 5'-bisphosphate nucleotidase